MFESWKEAPIDNRCCRSRYYICLITCGEHRRISGVLCGGSHHAGCATYVFQEVGRARRVVLLSGEFSNLAPELCTRCGLSLWPDM